MKKKVKVGDKVRFITNPEIADHIPSDVAKEGSIVEVTSITDKQHSYYRKGIFGFKDEEGYEWLAYTKNVEVVND
jgi:hypothetical protein